jgi:plastocyanin
MTTNRPLALAVLSAALVAGCGDDEGTSQPATDAGASIRMTETDFRLQPARATVPPGRLHVQITNRGESVHALAIETPGGKRTTDPIDPGATRTLETDLQPGRYVWYCPIGDHRRLGMQGTLTVKPGATSAPPANPDEDSAPPSAPY